MKQLDKFSRSENAAYKVLVYALFCVVPLAAVWMVDSVLMKGFSSLLRIAGFVIFLVIGWAIVMFFAGSLESLFVRIRKHLGLRPLYEIQKEVDDEKELAQQSAENSRKRWFTSLSESEQRFALWVMEKGNADQMKSINSHLVFFEIIVVGLIIAWLAYKYL